MKLLRLLFLFIVLDLSPLSAHTTTPPQSEYSLPNRYPFENQDPFHRHYSLVKPAIALWINEWNDQIDDLWTFIELKRDILEPLSPHLYDPAYHMVWLDETQRREYFVTFMTDEEGQISVSTPHDAVLNDGKWMYVMINGEFFVAKERKHILHHVSLAAGEPVQCSGTFRIKEGHLTNIALSSGHYHPEVQHGVQCIHRLHNLDLDLSKVTISYRIVINGEKIRKKESIAEFLQEYDSQTEKTLAPISATGV